MVSDKDFALLQDEVRLLRERLEGMLSRKGGYVDGPIAYSGDLHPERDSTQYTGYVLVIPDEALSSTNWSTTPKDTGDIGIIDMETEFSLPSDAKAVVVRIAAQDETTGVIFWLGPNHGYAPVIGRTLEANVYTYAMGIVPCDENGDIYFFCSGELDSVTLHVYAYFI